MGVRIGNGAATAQVGESVLAVKSPVCQPCAAILPSGLIQADCRLWLHRDQVSFAYDKVLRLLLPPRYFLLVAAVSPNYARPLMSNHKSGNCACSDLNGSPLLPGGFSARLRPREGVTYEQVGEL